MKKAAFVTLLIFLISCVYAESFRIRQAYEISLDQETTSHKVSVGYNDALVISLPANTYFIEGIEFSIKIPQELLTYQNCIAYSFYKNVFPNPSSTQIDYTGERTFIDMIPPRLSMVVQLPLTEFHNIKKSPYTRILPEETIPKQDYVFLRIQPVMKGLPENFDTLTFDMEIKPILSDKGLLDLQLHYPKKAEKKDVSVFIDELPVSKYNSLIELAAGIHYLAVTSEEYRTEVRTFTIEKARTTVLDIHLLDTTPALFISAPDNASVYLDDVRITLTGEPVIIAQGDHTIKMTVGGYEVTKTISAFNGKVYNVSFMIDIAVTEAP
ncbi:MAG: PEGA domain-containing protein [Spirochaetaceae bacterium]|nr:PEGA domain-containing protein [Spirochaetaceae bacterium]